MLGIRFIKFEPTTYVFKIKNGKVKREGPGLSFYYYAPTTSLVAVPIHSADVPFIFNETTSDFQEITIQGQLTYRIVDPGKISKLLDYSLNSSTQRPLSEDSQKLPQRLINSANVLTRSAIRTKPLKEALRSSDQIVSTLITGFSEDREIVSLGIEVLGVSVLAIRPNPETSKALEASTREEILRESDEAIFLRRNAAVEKERVIKENELNTEIAVEQKNREILETRIEAEKSVQVKKQDLAKSDMLFRIEQEERNQGLAALKSEIAKIESQSRAFDATALLAAFKEIDPEVLHAIAGLGMKPDQLIARAFQGMADRADKIGQLNVTPDLLQQLMQQQQTNL